MNKFFKDSIDIMKISYKLSNVSTLSADLLRTRIIAILKRKSYLITSDDVDKVRFKADAWLFQSKGAHFAAIDKGEFKILTKAERMELTFIYYLSYTPEILIMLFILLISYIMNDYRIVPFMGIPLWIQFALRYFKLKEVGEEMLEEIVTGIVE